MAAQSVGKSLVIAGTTIELDGDSLTPGNSKMYGTNGAGVKGWYTVGSADVVGPASATDNALCRFDATTGKLIQNSVVTVTDDGAISSSNNSGANEVSVPLCNWVMLTANYTLTNTVNLQKAFNNTANGALTLPTGMYEFEWLAHVTGMSATSGNALFDILGDGTAGCNNWMHYASGIDATAPLNAAAQTGSGSYLQETPSNALVATTGTGVFIKLTGMFNVDTAGTIVPSIALTTAAAAVMQAGCYFKIKRIGANSITYLGAWS